MHARSAVVELSPDKIDDAIRQFEADVLPRYREISGYKGFTMLVNRESGKAFGVSFWESPDGIKESDELGVKARDDLAATGGGSAQPREVWEVVLDDQT
ncbi:MAG: hypothetical protein WAK93_04070 [Solirubrobacteraceae bacterium]